MASRGVQATTQTGEQKVFKSEQVREGYYRRLDEHIKEAIDAYRSIIGSCSIRDSVAMLRSDFESQVDTSNLNKAVEGILQLISELKVASIVQEVTDTKQESHELRGVYDQEVKTAERAIANLSENILPVLESLEHHYYQSCTKWSTPVTSSSVSTTAASTSTAPSAPAPAPGPGSGTAPPANYNQTRMLGNNNMTASSTSVANSVNNPNQNVNGL